jgi:hypothetical protein
MLTRTVVLTTACQISVLAGRYTVQVFAAWPVGGELLREVVDVAE